MNATAPAGQAWQGEVAPGAALKNPTAQDTQVCADAAPTVELHVPGGHCWQAGAPLARVEKDPAGQLGAGVCEGVRVGVGVCVGVAEGVGELEGVTLGVGVCEDVSKGVGEFECVTPGIPQLSARMR